MDRKRWANRMIMSKMIIKSLIFELKNSMNNLIQITIKSVMIKWYCMKAKIKMMIVNVQTPYREEFISSKWNNKIRVKTITVFWVNNRPWSISKEESTLNQATRESGVKKFLKHFKVHQDSKQEITITIFSQPWQN